MDPVDARVNAKVGFIEMIIDFLTVKETDSFFVKFLRRLFLLLVIGIIGIVVFVIIFLVREANKK